jgi:hypothetical protein
VVLSRSLRFLRESLGESGGIEAGDSPRADDRDRNGAVTEREKIVVRRLVIVNDADGEAMPVL